MSLLWHVALLGVSIAALGAAALRCACRCHPALDIRIFGAVAFGAGFAVAESLLLGLVALGSNPWVLTAAALATWVGARVCIADPAPRPADQLTTAWAAASTTAHVAVGAIGSLALGTMVYQLVYPLIDGDGLTYHLAQIAIWVNDGRPGSFHQTLADFPTQAYPKNTEVLIGWFCSIARTPDAALLLGVPFFVTALAGGYVMLRRLGCGTTVAALATAAALLSPWNIVQITGVNTDLASITWLACTAAICVATNDDVMALAPAVVAAGLAIGTKDTVLPLIAVVLGWTLWMRRSQLRGHVRLLAAPVVLALSLGGVWYVADWVAYSSPLWPFSSFPSSRPRPYVWQLFGGSFAHDPVTTAKALGLHVYATYVSGGLVLFAAILVVVVLSLGRVQRGVRRTALVGGAVVVVDLVLWAFSPLSGVDNGVHVFAFSVLRYLCPAQAAAGVTLALLARPVDGGRRTAMRGVAIVALVAALGIDLAELDQPLLRVPIRPPLAMLIAMVTVGVTAGLLLARGGWLARLFSRRWVAPVVVVAVTLTVFVPARHFLFHYHRSSQLYGQTDTSVIDYLMSQPSWVNGNAPLAAGFSTYATLAGAHFQHPMTYIPNDEPCPAVRAAAQRGWVVLQSEVTRFPELNYTHPQKCMKGVHPAARLPNSFTVYAPAALISGGTTTSS